MITLSSAVWQHHTLWIRNASLLPACYSVCVMRVTYTREPNSIPLLLSWGAGVVSEWMSTKAVKRLIKGLPIQDLTSLAHVFLTRSLQPATFIKVVIKNIFKFCFLFQKTNLLFTDYISCGVLA